MSDIITLFPTSIGRYKFERGLKYKEINTINNQTQSDLLITNQGGGYTTKSGEILEHKDLYDIKTFILQSLNSYIDYTCKPVDDSLDIQITQSWCNLAPASTFHHLHKHDNSIFSGVFYIKVNMNDKIIFHRPPSANQIVWPVTEENIFNCKTWWIPVTTGDLLIFDSSLYHEVPRLTSEYPDMRISLSFNTFFTGKIGTVINKTLLNIEKITVSNEKNS